MEKSPFPRGCRCGEVGELETCKLCGSKRQSQQRNGKKNSSAGGRGLVSKRETRVCLTLTLPLWRNPFTQAPAEALSLCLLGGEEDRSQFLPLHPPHKTLLLLLAEEMMPAARADGFPPVPLLQMGSTSGFPSPGDNPRACPHPLRFHYSMFLFCGCGETQLLAAP